MAGREKEKTSREDVLGRVKELNVRFVRLQFTDILGGLKNVDIPVEQLPKALSGQISFDGSSILGFVRTEEADMILQPDPATLAIFPWQEGEGAAARLICDIGNPDGSPFAGCPRHTLKRVVAEMTELGFSTFNVGPEPEFFLFERGADGKPTTRPVDGVGYFDIGALDRGEECRRDIELNLQKMGFEIESSHHEVSPSQHEIDFKYADAVTAADNISTFRNVTRTIAVRHGLHATFMPKPIFGVNGSGLHLHMSLFRGRENAFADPKGEDGISKVLQQFLAGLLLHCRGYTAITNPTVNSYKRLVPGYEAPIYVAWSERNRSPLLRIPTRRGGGTRLELRSPDPSCNPYLALAAVLAAGLDGVRRGLTPPEPVNRNVWRMADAEREELGIHTLPVNLKEALQELEADEVIVAALGEHIVNHFLEAKWIEWDVYRGQVHNWELEQYLGVF